MASAKELLRTGPAWATAVLVTTVMASIIQSWQVQSGLTDLGVIIPSDLAVETALRDFTGLAVPVLAVFGVALALAFSLTAFLKPRLPLLAPIAWPFAGAAAVGTTVGLMHMQFNITPLAGARGSDGFILFCAAGAMGGCVFAWLKPRSQY